MGTNLNKALEAWGDSLPDWVRALAEECDSASQTEISKSLGYSATAINQALLNKYLGGTERIQQAVEGRFMNQTLICPVLDEVTKDICLEKQQQPFATTSAQRVRLFKACKICKHNRFRKI